MGIIGPQQVPAPWAASFSRGWIAGILGGMDGQGTAQSIQSIELPSSLFVFYPISANARCGEESSAPRVRTRGCPSVWRQPSLPCSTRVLFPL